MSRIVVTGMGWVTPFGTDLENVWQRLYNGEVSTKPITEFDLTDLYCKVACGIERNDEVFPWSKWKAELPKASNFVLYGLEAAHNALIDAGLITEENILVDEKLRLAVIAGSGIGGLDEQNTATSTMIAKGAHRVSPFFVPTALINLVAGHIAIRHQIKGPNQSQVAACSTGAIVVGDGMRMIKEGRCDVALVGAAESALCRLGIAGFCAIKALASGYNDEYHKASRPFDTARSGFVMGEGAGMLILESEEHALARGAKIYATVDEIGLSNDAYHITAPHSDGSGAARAINEALERAGLKPEDIDYVNAHATSTPVGDSAEMRGIKKVFGDHLNNMAVSSIKGAIGHMLGGAGAVELIASILCLKHQAVLPTANLENPDEECYINGKLINLIPKVGQKRAVRKILKNSFGFGGHNAAVIVGKYD